MQIAAHDCAIVVLRTPSTVTLRSFVAWIVFLALSREPQQEI